MAITLVLSPKDNAGKMNLVGVKSWAQEGNTLMVLFEDGRTRNYPHEHLWYWETRWDETIAEPRVTSAV